MIELSIIIVSYNTKELTLKCIESIVKCYGKELKTGRLEIIVVDNASADGSELVFSKLAQSLNFKLIVNKKNFGFAKGCNIGAKNAQGKYILFLNSDTEVKDDGFLKMVSFLDKNTNIGILGGKMSNPDGLAQPSVGKFYNVFNLFLMLFGGERFGLLRQSPKEIVSVDWVSGGCMMVRKKIFEILAGFDEHFFMYVEDMELCFRAKKLDYITYFFPEILLIHKELGSSNRAFAITHIYDGILYFYKKHKSNLKYNLAKFLLTAKATIAILIGTLFGNNYLKNTYREALRFL